MESEVHGTNNTENGSEIIASSKKLLEDEVPVELSTSNALTPELSSPTVQHSSKHGDKKYSHGDGELAVVPENATPPSPNDTAPTNNTTPLNGKNVDNEALKDAEKSALQSLEGSTQDKSTLNLSGHKDKETQSAVDEDRAAKRRRRKERNRQSRLPKIVYVDDSPADSRTMAKIVEKMGYQYTNIPDPLQALPMLIELKPKLIFLDLVMPIANGYEICAQIRRVSSFKKTPIVIVTSNDGIADRVRAKIVGASGFMGKPIKEKKVIKVFKKYLSYVEPMKR